MTIVENGIEYEEQGPYCQLCGAHMGLYYSDEGEPDFLNPHDYEDYGDNTCPNCGAEYEYTEGDALVLTEEDKEALLALRQL